MKDKERQRENIILQQKKTLSKQLFEFILNFRILLDDEIVHVPAYFLNILILLSIIQETSLLIDDYYDLQHVPAEFMKCLIIIAKFTRPYLIFWEEFYKYSYLIPLSISVVYYLFVGVLFIQFKVEKNKQKRVTNLFHQQPRIFIMLISLLVFYQSLQFHLLFIPQLELIIHSLTYNSKELNLDIFNIAFGIISLIILLGNMMLQMVCNLVSIDLKFKTYGIIKQSFSFYWQQVTYLVIVLINELNVTDSTKFYLLFSLLILKTTVNVQSQLISYVSMFKRAQADFVAQSCQITVLVILFILNSSKIKSNKYESLLLLLIFPIIISVVKELYTRFHNQILINAKISLNPSEIQYRIVNVIYKYGKIKSSYIKKGEPITIIENFKSIHQAYCDSSSCLCRTIHHTTLEQNVQLFLKDQVKIFGESINTVKDHSERNAYFLHYLLFINYLGMNTKAFQQSNVRLYQDSDFNSFAQYSNQRSEAQKVGSSNSLDQKSHSLQRSKNEKDSDQLAKIKVQNMNLIQQIKLKLLQDLIKQSMSNSLKKTKNIQVSENLEHAVNLFLQSEEGNNRLKQKIIKNLQSKRQFFNNILLNAGQMTIFVEAKQLLIKMKKAENELLKLYDQFPSHKMQALNTFFQSEIMNNFFSAYKIATVASISDEKLLKMQSQVTFDLFSSKIDYLIMGFDSKSHHLQIRQTSNLIHQFFGFSQEQFKMLNYIEYLLPQGFDLIHQKLVVNFLQEGESKFFRSINLSFSRIQSKCMKPIDFFFDINLASLDDLTFVSFLQDTSVSSAYILCIQNTNKIQCITKNLVQKLGYSNNSSKQLIDCLINIQANKICPKLNNIYETFITSKSLANPQFMSTVEEKQDNFDQSENQIIMTLPSISALEKSQKINWDEENLTQFQVDVAFHLRNMNQDPYQYLIIEIRDAKRHIKTDMSTPFQTDFHTSTNHNLEQLIDLTAQDEEELFQDEEYCINTPKAMEFYEDENNTEHFGSRVRIKNERAIANYPNISIALVSPKDSGVRLIDDKNEISQQQTANITIKRNKQQYFSAIGQKEEPESSDLVSSVKVSQQNNNNKIKDEFQNDDIDKDLQQNIQMQLQFESQHKKHDPMNDGDSDVSSQVGIKRSKYSKKYDLLEKVINSDKFSHKFINMKYVTATMFLEFLLFTIIEVSFSQADLSQFLAELSLLQIKANIVGPIDNYIVGYNSVVNYAVLASTNQLTAEQAYEQSRYAFHEINYTYFELKTSFETQLQNKYLDPFFQDRYVQVQMADYPNLDTYNITIREAIQLELEAALMFIKINYLALTDIDFTQAQFAYLLKNYHMFYDEFKILNTEMLSYSVNRASVVSQKWYYLLIPIIIIGAVLLIGAFSYYKLYLQSYDEFLSLFSFIDNVWLQRDIERYRGITALLIKDSDVLFKYQFDLENKEKFLASEDIRKEKIALHQKQQKEKSKQQYVGMTQKISQLPSLFTFALIYGVCFIFCFISNSLGQNYYTKYPNSCTFFNTLSDISMASSGVFSAKEISYTIQNEDLIYFFFPDRDASPFIDVFFTHIGVIQNFLDLTTKIDFSDYLTSDQFLTNFNAELGEDICSFLPHYKIAEAQPHCDSAQGGVMRRGMIQTLNKVKNTLLDEYESSNKFKVETVLKEQDLEIGLMSYDDLNDLRDQFQTQLNDFTNQLSSQLIIINSCFIVFIIISLIALFTVVEQYFRWEFQLVKHFVILLPQTSLFIDIQLDRNLRQLIVKDDLI